MAEKNILITGANGQLGQCFQLLGDSYSGLQFYFTAKDDLDICNATEVEAFVVTHNIGVLINCAAYTAVDKAESEQELALQINGHAVELLATVCKKVGAQFIHFSTDYVFAGLETEPYQPHDETNPVNFYGSTKLLGEHKALQANEHSLVIRTSWVYSPFGKNFVKTMKQLLTTRETISVVSDQKGSPTYAVDLANAVLKIIAQNKPFHGLYHYCNQGIISWFDFAIAIKEELKVSCEVKAIPTTEFPTPAKRPGYSALDTSSFQNDFQITIPEWKESLSRCIQMMNEKETDHKPSII